MNRIEELEQLKKEYQEIPIPETGVLGVQAAMERAKQKKHLKERMIRSVTSVAAAAVLLLVIPQGIFAMSGWNAKGGAEMAPDTAGKENRYEAEKNGFAESTDSSPGKLEAPIPSENVYGESMDAQLSVEALLQSAEVRERISADIRRQIEEATLQGEECFTAEKRLTEGFTCILPEQDYYINEEGQLVIVFAPGEIAPREYGKIEFVILDEVIRQ